MLCCCQSQDCESSRDHTTQRHPVGQLQALPWHTIFQRFLEVPKCCSVKPFQAWTACQPKSCDGTQQVSPVIESASLPLPHSHLPLPCPWLPSHFITCPQFTHVTRFLGKKVVLLGLYNGHKLQDKDHDDVVMYSRVMDEGTPQASFVRVLLLRGRMQGAVLIGETDLEETFENLILDGLDLSQYGPALLDPDIELDHVFD